MVLFIWYLLIYNAIQCDICLISALFNLHQCLARNLLIYLLQEMLYLMKSCNSPFLKVSSEGTCFSLSTACTYLYAHKYIFIAHYRFSQSQNFCLSGKFCVPTLSILILALTLSLLKQARTDSPLSSFISFLS